MIFIDVEVLIDGDQIAGTIGDPIQMNSDGTFVSSTGGVASSEPFLSSNVGMKRHADSVEDSERNPKKVEKSDCGG